MKDYKVKELRDDAMNSVVGGGVATTTGAAITCGAGVGHVIFLIAAMISEEHKEELYKTAAAFASISLTGFVSTVAISKISSGKSS